MKEKPSNFSEEPGPDFITVLISFTERQITRKRRRKARKRIIQAKRNRLVGWLDAFIWAVIFVLLLNQYFIQGYQIPSGSMRNTLIGGRDPVSGEISSSDRIFVDKFRFGPELLPGVGKLKGLIEPQRTDIIVFESPDYNSPSIIYEIAQRVIYMLSFSLIDLNRIRYGQVAVQFLVKRQIAENGDRVRFRSGHLQIQPPGAELMTETDFKKQSGLDYNQTVLLGDKYYKGLRYDITRQVFQRAGLATPPAFIEDDYNKTAPDKPALKKQMIDQYEGDGIFSGTINRLDPYNKVAASRKAAWKMGIYVPKDWVLPLGDNRSDSLDGRYFGPIPRNSILGSALFLYWPPVPFKRLGQIR